MKTWRQFRAALVRLMEDGGVSRQQMLKAAESSMAEPRPSDTPDFGAIKRSTLYAYLKASDDPVGSDWDVIKNVLLCIASLAEKNKKPLDIDQNTWEIYWNRLGDNPHRRPSSSDPNSWIGSWDGAADAALTHASAEEFIKWPQGGGSRLDELSQAVSSLSAAYQPRLAKEAAQELVNAAQAELGGADPKTLAARHAFAFWTGETGDSRLALDLTASLLSDCRKCLGPDHILTRLAALRKALWTCYTGNWREANRGYIEVVSSEVRRPDRDQHIWLLARWGMARTGGRTGNWRHADTELADLLPSVVETFGADHLATFSAEAAHAWAAGRAGRPEEARSRLEDLATRAETTLGPDHPVSLRIRTASAHWTHAVGSTAKALQLAASTREACESRMGTMHPLSIQAAEVEALCLLETDEKAALASLSDVLSRMTQLLGPDHPQTLQAMSNLAAARAAADGSGVNPKQFKNIAKRLGNTLGKEHPDTLRARANVAIAVLNTQGAVAALPLFRKTYASFSMVLGDGHPETAMSRDLLVAVEEQIPRPEAPRRVKPDKQHRSRGPSFNIGSDAGDPPSSDRAVKCDVDPVVWSSAPTNPGDQSEIEPENGWTTPPTQQNGFDILTAVASLPVSTWSYRGEENVRHLGPMAQDWYAAFGLGADDRSIHMIDANGVAIVAMQALHRMVQNLQQEVDSLRSRLGTDEASKSRRDDKRLP